VYSVTINQTAYPGCIAKSAPFYYKTLKANAGNDTIINAGESAVLGGYPEYFGNSPNTVNFFWTPLTGLSNGTGLHPLAAPDTTTNYIMILQDGSSITKINDTVKVVVLPTVCPGGSTSFTPVNLPPGFTNHQWQLDKGTGFANLPTFGDGVHSGSYYSTLTITTPPASYYGYRYRCISNNGQTESIVNGIYTLKFGVRWTGAVSSDWHNPANWNCGVKPDGFTDVVVSAGTPNPLVISSNAICHLIKVQPGADITIAPGVQLTITGR
jgi:hypothetical protein